MTSIFSGIQNFFGFSEEPVKEEHLPPHKGGKSKYKKTLCKKNKTKKNVLKQLNKTKRKKNKKTKKQD